jgi:ABC-type Fe3+-hydroxamate transport system substrate-binding protein
MNAVVDALGRRVNLPRVPQRIVSLVPSLTEWLFALSLVERIVGVTDFCLHPADLVAHKPKLRGTKNPNRPAIVALQPDLVLASKEENRQRDVDALHAAGIPAYVTDIVTVANAIKQLALLADLLGAHNAAQPLLHNMRQAYAALPQPQRRSRVLALIWREPWMAIGADTYAGDLLERCGAHNVGAELGGRYPRFPLDLLPSLALDQILLLSEPYAFGEQDLPPLQAHFSGPINFVDGELLTWYGPRIGLALRTFGALFG